jgi:hypothetical protein
MSETLDDRLRAILAQHEASIARERDRPRTKSPANETCGAKTRAGTPCKRRDIYSSGRCRMHGGLSTGPKTPEGKAKVAINLRRSLTKPVRAP